MEAGRVLGRYQLERQLGQGGMGAVWAARHLELGTYAAVKVIDPTAMASGFDVLARFKREAQAAASLRSSNVVQILDYGVDEGTPFIVMEMLVGETLGDRLKRSCPMPHAEVAHILSQAGRAIGMAHEAHIVHRDLKPDNIYLAQDGDQLVVKVLDFGIAKTSNALDASSSGLTRTGAMLGTPFYMSPEQASGQRSVDHRSDIWALGVIAYQCVTGHRPFERDTIGGLVLAICTEPIPVPSHWAPVPPGFDEWFAMCVCRDPAGRYQSVKEQMAVLRSVCLPEAAPDARASLPSSSLGYIPAGTVNARASLPSFEPQDWASPGDYPPAAPHLEQSGDTQQLDHSTSPASMSVEGGPSRGAWLGLAALLALGFIGAVVVGIIGVVWAVDNAASGDSAAVSQTPDLSAVSAESLSSSEPTPSEPRATAEDSASLPATSDVQPQAAIPQEPGQNEPSESPSPESPSPESPSPESPTPESAVTGKQPPIPPPDSGDPGGSLPPSRKSRAVAKPKEPSAEERLAF